jgi:hypothetical protein
MKELREFLSEVTEVDSRLLKTVIALFRNPRAVLDESLERKDTYTKPLRYLLFTSTLFIIWRFIYEHYVLGFFTDLYPEVEGYWPGRIAKANSKFIDLQDTFFPFQILLFVVPFAIILLKLLFIKKKWHEVYHITLYSFGHFWIVLSAFVPVLFLFNSQLLLLILVAFSLIGLFFRKLLSKNLWVGFIKWLALSYFFIIWFYKVSLPVTQWVLAQVVLPDRYELKESTKPLQSIQLPLNGRIQFITNDPENCFFVKVENQNGLLVQYYKPDTTLLWQTMLPGVKETQKALRAMLPTSEQGFLILAEAIEPGTWHAIVISANGKILFTKIYNEGKVLNGGDMVNETLVLTGGKTNGLELSPFIDVIQLKFSPHSNVLESGKDFAYALPGFDNRYDDVYILGNTSEGLDIVFSKFEMVKASELSPAEINHLSVMRAKIDSVIQPTWETEIFRRNSKYWPLRGDDGTFQMRYDPSFQRILAFYSLADDKNKSTQFFWIDTLGTIKLQEKIVANEITYLTDVYSTQDGIFFCGWSELGLRSPFLGFGSQGLIGFIPVNGDPIWTSVGKPQQGRYLTFYKIVANKSIMVWGVQEHGVLMYEGEWELMKFDRQLFLKQNDQQGKRESG